MDDVVIKNLSNKGIRTGKQYLEGLRDDRNVWMHGKKVQDVTNENGLKRCANTLANFIDRQHDPKYINNLPLSTNNWPAW